MVPVTREGAGACANGTDMEQSTRTTPREMRLTIFANRIRCVTAALETRRLQIVDLHGIERAGRLEAEDRAVEEQLRLQTANDRLRPAEPVLLSFERDVG